MNLSGAVLGEVVPAFRFKYAVEFVTPIPTFPLFNIVIASVDPLSPTLKCISAPVVPVVDVGCSVRDEVGVEPPSTRGVVILELNTFKDTLQPTAPGAQLGFSVSPGEKTASTYVCSKQRYEEYD